MSSILEGLRVATSSGFRLRVVSSIDRNARTWLNQATGAAVRAFLVMVVIVLPSVVLPGTETDTRQIVALVALFAGGLVFVEYNAIYPSLIEFRDGAPFNRIRYLMLLAIVLFLSVSMANRVETSAVSGLFGALGDVIGQALDFPYSPVRLATLMLDETATAQDIAVVRSATGTSYLVSLLSLAIFVTVLKLAGWPSTKTAFNVWVNLPTFDPTAGGDVVDRLERSARLNISVGFLMPFVVPLLIAGVTAGLPTSAIISPQPLIWTAAIWAFMPASLLMRGVAMGRVADMIRMKRDMKIAADAGQAGDPADDEDTI